MLVGARVVLVVPARVMLVLCVVGGVWVGGSPVLGWTVLAGVRGRHGW